MVTATMRRGRLYDDCYIKSKNGVKLDISEEGRTMIVLPGNLSY
jgi:hypothetical protein